MKFVDTVEIEVLAGNGGAGSVHFHREKFIDKGGPDGGDGGSGGDVILVADSSLSTLDRFLSQKVFQAQHGEAGKSTNRCGQDAKPLIIKLPIGTVIEDAETGMGLGELIHQDDQIIIAKGGKGGKGNSNFATSVNQAPTYAQPGLPGEAFHLRLTLKLIADAGLIGVPNAGKSTLLSMVSRNDAEVGDYPFTTLNPNLGVLYFHDRRLILADIPGIIEGASKGAGLGLSFLKHIERVNLIIYLIDMGSLDVVAEFRMLRLELSRYSEKLLDRPFFIVFNKADQAGYDDAYQKTMEAEFRKAASESEQPIGDNTKIIFISAKNEKNLDTFIETTFSFFTDETHAERLIRKQ